MIILDYFDYGSKFWKSILKQPPLTNSAWSEKYWSRYRQLNADIVPIKSLYFESGYKRLEPGEKYGGFYGNFSVFKWSYFNPVWQYSSNIVKTCLFEVLFHPMLSKCEISKKNFMKSSLKNINPLVWAWD